MKILYCVNRVLRFCGASLLLLGSVHPQVSNTNVSAKLSPDLRHALNKLKSETVLPLFPAAAPPIKVKGDRQLYGVTIRCTNPDELKRAGLHINSTNTTFCTARLTLDEVAQAAKFSSVSSIRGDRLEYPLNDIARAATGAALLHNAYINNTAYKGDGVLIGIFDTGIDWSHLDFRNESDTSQSRILYIWDQSLTPGTGEASPAGFDYGVEYTQTQINNELSGITTGFVREKDVNGHGTHVAGSAAGSGNSLNSKRFAGMAPKADIIFVKGGDGSFPTSYIIDALTYIKQKADALAKPAVVNLSLGSDYGPHDGTDDKGIAMRDFGGAGRLVTAAAGNSGAGNIHVSANLPNNDSIDIEFVVPAYTPVSGSVNDYFGFDLWLSSNSNINAKVISPNGYSTAITTGADTTTLTNDGGIYLWNMISSGNNNTEIEMDIYDAEASRPPAQGTWKLRLINTSGGNITYHGWLYSAGIGGQYVTLTDGNTGYTLANTSGNTLIVGSYVDRWRWSSNDGSTGLYSGSDYSDNLSAFSSKGPTRDGRQKPDVICPGQGIFSTRSKYVNPAASILAPGGRHYLNQGTSMASPLAAGAAALLLQKDHSLTPEEIITLLTETAISDSYTGTVPSSAWGYGKLDVFSAMSRLVNASLTSARKCYYYDEWSSDNAYSFSKDDKLAVRFSPAVSGIVSGLFIHPSIFAVSAPLQIEIWSDDGTGLPQSKISNTVQIDSSDIMNYSWNYFDTRGCSTSVASGGSYHVVIYYNSVSTSSMRIDAGNISGRSSIWNSGTWSQYSGGDFRIRPVVTESPSALPVELISFTARRNKNCVVLDWITATESNNIGWEVERKTAGDERYIKIGFVTGSGNSSTRKSYSFLDNTPAREYSIYRLKQINSDGSYSFSAPAPAVIFLPDKYELYQNFPNPFNLVTTIQYDLPAAGQVSLKVFDLPGREILTIVDADEAAGHHSIQLDAGSLASGVYFLKLQCGGNILTRKMILVK